MAVHPIDYRYGSDEMKRIFEEEARLNYLLKVEAAVARANAEFGNIPMEAALEIEKKASPDFVRLERVKEIEAEIKHDLMAVVKALSEVCGEAGKYVHFGATSYDVVDTANALQFKEAIAIVKKDLEEVASILKELAEKHKSLVAVGRTHGQHATPITYGLKFAVYYAEIKRNIQRLKEAEKRIIAGKLSGAVGTYAALGEKGFEIEKRVMEILGINIDYSSTQVVQRDRYAELFCILAIIAASFEKIAKEIRNLSRTEIAELSEGFGEKQVGSSAMPHKKNPINSEKICSLARVIRSNAIVALENIALEHERDLTNSANERVIIPESFILIDEILKTAKKTLKSLIFNYEKIKENLYLSKSLNLAESVMQALVKKGMPRQEAHELLRKLSQKAIEEEKSFEEILSENKVVSRYLSIEEIKELLKPENYIGLAVEKTERILRDY